MRPFVPCCCHQALANGHLSGLYKALFFLGHGSCEYHSTGRGRTCILDPDGLSGGGSRMSIKHVNTLP